MRQRLLGRHALVGVDGQEFLHEVES